VLLFKEEKKDREKKRKRA
jgi:RNA-binding protein 25